jgi:hypothetical protein
MPFNLEFSKVQYQYLPLQNYYFFHELNKINQIKGHLKQRSKDKGPMKSNILCRNPSFGFTTKAKACEGVGQK